MEDAAGRWMTGDGDSQQKNEGWWGRPSGFGLLLELLEREGRSPVTCNHLDVDGWIDRLYVGCDAMWGVEFPLLVLAEKDNEARGMRCL